MKKKFLCALLAAIVFTGCSQIAEDYEMGEVERVLENDHDTICQISLLQGLLQGDYNGSISIGELKSYGDIGIGTFDGLNGELIMLDGVVYRAKGDGTVDIPGDSETIPFSNVTFFEPDDQFTVTDIDDFDSLTEFLDDKVEQLGVNRFYMVRIDGTFNQMHVRSEYAQTEPYLPLVEVLETDQTFFNYANVQGTIVALYCPVYMAELNNAGWHMHFISADRTMGGHVLDFQFDEATVSIDCTDNFTMLLPDNDYFNNTDFSIDRSEDVRRAETNE